MMISSPLISKTLAQSEKAKSVGASGIYIPASVKLKRKKGALPIAIQAFSNCMPLPIDNNLSIR